MSSANPITRALTSLLPSSLPIPPRLLSAASTLLSLSQQRASNLKPDEEIARAHACAELACKRLRVDLRLPNIKSGNGAPCRPNVYKKLLSFLEKTLEDVEVHGTPRKQKAGELRTPTTSGRSIGTGKSTGGRKRNIEALDMEDEDVEVETPTKPKRRRTGDGYGRDELATPTESSSKKTNGFIGKIAASASQGNKGTEVPDYVLPSIRKLCKAFKTPKMVPHVHTGVCVVLDVSGTWPRSVETDLLEERAEHTQDVLRLVVAVYLMTLTRMQRGLMTTSVYDAVSKRSIEMLDMGEEHDDAQAGIEEWIARINDGGWTAEGGKGEGWWGSVPEDVIAQLKLSTIRARSQGADLVELDEGDEDTPRASRISKHSNLNGVDHRRKELRKQLEEEDPDDVLLPGLGTMMNDAVDYLSEERTADFEVWKADILKRMDSMEKGGGSAKKGKGRAVAAAA